MHLTPTDKNRISGAFTVVREPARPDVAAQSDPKVIETVSSMLSDIERNGLPAVRRYAEHAGRLDWR
jgi:sulfopropanediol 3-dehydrogenase